MQADGNQDKARCEQTRSTHFPCSIRPTDSPTVPTFPPAAQEVGVLFFGIKLLSSPPPHCFLLFFFLESIHSIHVYRSVGSRLFVSWKLFSLSNIWKTYMNYRAVWIILFRKESIYLRLWFSCSSQATWTTRQIWSSTYIDLLVPDWLL